MSYTVIEPLVREQSVLAQPITEIQEQVYSGLQAFWGQVRQECEERFTPAQCRALLGARPTMLEPQPRAPGRADGIAWYWLFGAGLFVGKVIL